MKIQCSCGTIIPDQTDFLPYKARFIADEEWFDFWENIDRAIVNLKEEKEKLLMNVRQSGIGKFFNAYQCSKCGKLFIENRNHELQEFSPVESKDDVQKEIFKRKT